MSRYQNEFGKSPAGTVLSPDGKEMITHPGHIRSVNTIGESLCRKRRRDETAEKRSLGITGSAYRKKQKRERVKANH